MTHALVIIGVFLGAIIVGVVATYQMFRALARIKNAYHDVRRPLQ